MSVIKSLTTTLAEKKAAKYDPALEDRIRQWIGSVLGSPVEGELCRVLKDGTLLCQTLNKMCPGLVPRINASSLPFKQMENITTFIQGCQKLGLQATELFETPDLYNAADMMRVLQCLDRVMQMYEKHDQQALMARVGGSKPASPPPIARASSPLPPRTWQKKQAEAQLAKEAAPAAVAPPKPIERLDTAASSSASTPSVSSLHEDIATRSEFKYSAELERIAREWMEQILGEDLSRPTFAECLKSGSVLIRPWLLIAMVRVPRLLNAIKPGTVTDKIHLTKIKYHQMENIEHFLQGCRTLGVESVNLFNTSDLFEEKAMFLVINAIIVLANSVKTKDWYKGPAIADASKAKSLWSESLGFTDFSLAEEDVEDQEKPLSPEQQDLVDWVNAQLVKSSVPVRPVKNLSTNVRSGVVLMRLVEVLTTQKRTAWDEQPKYLWQHMKNATAVLSFIASVTFEQVPNVTARDIVSMRVDSIVLLLNYLRDKFDLDFLFQKVLNEELKDEEKEIHMHVTTQVADLGEEYYEEEYYEEEDGYYEEEWYEEDAEVVPAAENEAAEKRTKQEESERVAKQIQDEKEEKERKQAAEQAERKRKEEAEKERLQKAREEESERQRKLKHQLEQEEKERLRLLAEQKEKEEEEEERKKQAVADEERRRKDREGQERIEKEKKEAEREKEQSPKSENEPASPVSAEEVEGEHKEGGKREKRKSFGAVGKKVVKLLDHTKGAGEKEKEKDKKDKKKKEKKRKSSKRDKKKVEKKEKEDATITKPSESNDTAIDKGKRRGSKQEKKKGSLREKHGEVEKTKRDERKPESNQVVPAEPSPSVVEKEKEAASAPASPKSAEAEPKPSSSSPATARTQQAQPASAAIAESRPQVTPTQSTAAAAVLSDEPKKEEATNGQSEAQAAAQSAAVAENATQGKHDTAVTSAPATTRSGEVLVVSGGLRTRGSAIGRGMPAGRGRGSFISRGGGEARSRNGTLRRIAVPPPAANGEVDGRARPEAAQTKTEALQDIQAIKMEKARNVVRQRVASEILSTEKSYASSLALVSQQVLALVQLAGGKILSPSETQNLFWNWDELCGHHAKFLQLLKDRIEKWDTSTTLGDIFLHHTDFLESYRPYLVGYNTSVVTLRHLEKRKPAFKAIKHSFENEQKKTTALDLESYLIMPVQRELHKYTNPLHVDYALLEQAATKISKQLSTLNAGIDNEQMARALKLHSIEDSIEGEIIPGETLFNPSRRYVREGVMQLTSKDVKEKQFYFFLFNDLLVCCDKKKGDKKKGAKEGPEEFSLLFSLLLATVLRIDDSQLEKKGKVTLVMSEEKGKEKLNYGLVTKDKREKVLWCADLKASVDDAKKVVATK